MTVGIYYATTTGKTEDVADRLHNFISSAEAPKDVSDVDDLKKVSKLTKKSLLVLKVIRGDDPEQPMSKSELKRILTDEAREDEYRLSRRGLDLVLQNLLDLHLIIETNDGSYRFGSSDIIIPLDLLMEQLTEGG